MSRTASVLNHVNEGHELNLSYCGGTGGARLSSSTNSESRKRSRAHVEERELLSVPFTIHVEVNEPSSTSFHANN